MAHDDELDSPEFTPLPAPLPNATTKRLADLVIKEHQELVRCRLQKEALQMRVEDLERELEALKRVRCSKCG